jgi:hypothetical protein
VIRRILVALALVAALGGIATPSPVAAFSGFGPMQADATYGKEMTFSVTLDDGVPDRLEILLDFEGSDATFVAPATIEGNRASYRWDVTDRFVTPNTRITYRWRATVGERQQESAPGTLLYDDDRPGLDWRSAAIGDAVLHWYGGAEGQARHFGDLADQAARQAEALLGHQLSGPLDIFVYARSDAFFGALGPGAREWTGAATYPDIRTVFMNLENNSADYLDTVVRHEVTHVVFNDATANPYHEPARWLNEGIATWSEQRNANQERATVRSSVSGGLFAFDALTGQFPIGDRGALLSYAEGATMVDMIIQRYGTSAIARIAAAYRDGATDAAALQAGTGVAADTLYADYFRSFGASEPTPIQPAPLPSSMVPKGEAAAPGASPAAGASASAAPDGSPARQPAGSDWLVLIPLVAIAVAALALVRLVWVRSARTGGG